MKDKKVLEYCIEIGNDNGNSEHDIMIDGILIEQPNVISKVRKLPMLDEINPVFVAENIHDNSLATVTTTSAAPGIYFSGRYALKSGEKVRNIEVGVDNNKLNSDIPVINTIERIAGYCVNKAFKEEEDLNKIEIVAKVDMTTALPVTQYTKSQAESFSEKFMNGDHIALVHVGTINVKVTIKFEYVKTLPESVPATFAFQNMVLIEKTEGELTEEELNDNKKVKELFSELNLIEKPESELTEKELKHNNKIKSLFGDNFIDGRFFKKKRILHTGIGEGTTEYPLTIDIEFDPNFIHGSNNGIGHAIDNSLPEFKKELGLLNYSRQNYSEILKDPTHKYYDIAAEIVEQYIEEQSEEILHNIKNQIQRANNEVDIVCVYGGGSILMRDHLENKLDNVCSKANIILFYVPANYAVTLESQGMYQFTKNKIFKMLKSRYLKKN